MIDDLYDAASVGITTLQRWYDPTTGLWQGTGWWNAANVLWVILDYAARTNPAAYQDIIAQTFECNAQGQFLNEFYDDEGWWALTWIKAYDLTQDARYLHMATVIFTDMLTGWDNQCGGGIWWNKERKYKNAIPNELFMTIAARLAQRASTPQARAYYLNWAQGTWAWFEQSGLINPRHLINDGLNEFCVNNGDVTWTYTQGVILGGLVDLCKLTNHTPYLQWAEAIADAAIQALVDDAGLLQEPCESGDCGADGPQFKGIFMRNLAYLYEVVPKPAYRQFMLHNASAIATNNRTIEHFFGLKWSGPVDSVDPARQSSALDTLVVAMSLA